MENSESGAPIHRYEASEREFEVAFGDSDNIQSITDHFEQHIGPVASVYHELLSDLVHIDVYTVEPTEQRDFYTLFTSGMSDRPMPAPDEYPDLKYAELMICLPSTWAMGDEAWKVEENYWPIRLLKFLARFPHEYGAWVWAMHTVPNGDPAEPFASNTQLNGAILLPPVTVPREFHELEIDAEKTIHFHAVIPLYQEEMQLKLDRGAEALFDGFDQNQVSEILDVSRTNVAAKRRRWLPWGN